MTLSGIPHAFCHSPLVDFRRKMHSVQTLLYWCASRTALIWDQAPEERPHMRRNVESPPKVSPVDVHERARDYLSEAEFALLLQGTVGSRYRWRNTAMLMLTFSPLRKGHSRFGIWLRCS